MTVTGPAHLSETQERFLRAIAERLAPEQVVELHLFPPLRQGPIESAVAVIAVAGDAEVAIPTAASGAADGPLAPDPDAREADAPALPAANEAPRHAVYSATYRHTRKGPDRGAWSVDVTAQADAPLDAVAAVVRGVQRRSDGEWAGAQLASDDGLSDADRLSGADFRAIVGRAAGDSATPSAPAASDGPASDGPASDGPPSGVGSPA